MSARSFRNAKLSALGLLCAWACGCAAHPQQATAKVILAGSVCSAEPPLPAADVTQPAAAERALLAYVAERAPGRTELVLHDLSQGQERFRVAVGLRSRPQVLGDVVVAVDDKGQLRGYDLASGALRWSHPVERESWLGAVQVGEHVVYTSSSLSFRPADRGSTVTGLSARNGSLAWRREVPYVLSKPHASGTRVLVLSDHADVWALSANSGKSAGCSRPGAESVDWLEPSPRDAALLLGARDARRLALAPSLREEGARLQLPLGDLPGQPSLHASSYDSVPAGRSAHGRVGLSVQLESSAAGPALAGGHYYFAFYRELFAYRRDGQLAWARLFPADAVRVQVVGDSVLVITESGEVSWLRAQDGAAFARTELSARIASADVAVTQLPAALSQASVSPASALRAELREIAIDPDARLLPGRRLACSALARLPDPEATRDLLEVYVQPAAPVELKRHIAALLAERRVGSELLVAALEADYDFLSSMPAPPLAAIVPGLVKNDEARAVPRLIDRLFDPDTQVSELVLVVDAIAGLGGAVAQKPLSQFLAMYHADSALADDPSALLHAARVLWTTAAANDVKLVQTVAQDPATLEPLRSGLVPLMATAEPVAAPEPVASAPAPVVKPKLPETLSDEAIANTFAEHAAELRECVSAELAQNPGLRALRFTFVVDRGGALSRFEVWPKRDALSSCLTPKLLAARFPAFVRGPRVASYTLQLRQSNAKDASDEKLEPPPFWFYARLRGAAAPLDPAATPWWHNQNPLFVAVDEPSPAPAAADTPAQDEPSPGARAQDAQQRVIMKRTQEEQKKTEPAPADSWWVPAQQ